MRAAGLKFGQLSLVSARHYTILSRQWTRMIESVTSSLVIEPAPSWYSSQSTSTSITSAQPQEEQTWGAVSTIPGEEAKEED